MGLKTNIEHRHDYKALKPPAYTAVWQRNDNVFAFIYQTQKGEDIHLICYNTTGSKSRAKKWAKLKTRRIISEWYKNWGLITTLKLLWH